MTAPPSVVMRRRTSGFHTKPTSAVAASGPTARITRSSFRRATAGTAWQRDAGSRRTGRSRSRARAPCAPCVARPSPAKRLPVSTTDEPGNAATMPSASARSSRRTRARSAPSSIASQRCRCDVERQPASRPRRGRGGGGRVERDRRLAATERAHHPGEPGRRAQLVEQRVGEGAAERQVLRPQAAADTCRIEHHTPERARQ